MNRIYEPHRSSILDLDANLLCVLLYLIPLISFFIQSFRILVWLIPLIAYLIEKNSPLVKFHAAQCLIIQLTVSVVSFVLWLIAAVSAGASLLIGFNVLAFFGTVGITGIVTLLLCGIVLVMEIVAMIKAYHWISYRLPIFGEIAGMFVKE